MLTDVIDHGLTESQWDLVHKVATGLVIADTDANELQKAIAYLRSVTHHKDAVERFFKYLATLVSRGQQVAHSKRTQGYYRNLDKVCSKHLKGKVSEAEKLLEILSWAVRLMKYYKNVGPIGEEARDRPEPSASQESERQREIREAAAAETFAVGQVIRATVTAIKGNKVTYLILGTIRLTQKEPKKATLLEQDQVVNVQITQLTDTGAPKKVKYVD